MLTNETLETIRQRRSVRSFQSAQLKDEELHAILDAGQLAPYAEERSRHFTVIQNRKWIEQLSREAKKAATLMGIPSLLELGQENSFHCLYCAPTAIIVSGNEKSAGPESDCAAATQNILIAAESLGIGSCWVFYALLAFLSPAGDGLKRELQIPDGFKPFTSIALGYKVEETLPLPRKRMDGITYLYEPHGI